MPDNDIATAQCLPTSTDVNQSFGPEPTLNQIDQQIGSKVARGLSWSLANSLLLRMGNLAVGIVLARLLTPHEFGTFAVGLTVLTILTTVSELGMTADLVRKGDVERRAPTVMTIGFGVSLTLTMLLFTLAPTLATTLGSPEATSVIRVLSLSLLLSGVSSVPIAILQRRFQQNRQLAADFTCFVVSTVLTLIMIQLGFGAMSLAWSRLIAQLTTWLLLLFLAKTTPRFGFDKVIARELVSFGLPLCGANFLSWLLLNIDYMMIGHVSGAAQLGIYVLAFNVASWPTSALTQAVRSVALPGYSRILTSKSSASAKAKELSAALVSSTSLTWWGAVPMTALIAGLASPLIRLFYGPVWAAAIGPLMALAAFGALRTVIDLWATFLVAVGATRGVLAIQILWTATLIPAIALGLRLGGLAGAGWAHVVVAVLVVLPAYLIVLRRQGVELTRLLRPIVPPTAAATAAGITAWGVSTQLDQPLVALLVGGTVGASVYLGATRRRLDSVFSSTTIGRRIAESRIAGRRADPTSAGRRWARSTTAGHPRRARRRPAIVYLAGVAWDGVVGTDRQLAERLARMYDLVWVDPPESVLTVVRRRLQGRQVLGPGLTTVAGGGVQRLHSVTLPGGSRPIVRTFVRLLHRRTIRIIVRRLDLPLTAVILANPQCRFPALSARKVLYVTDDWVAGADLMGLSRSDVSRQLTDNLAIADLVCAVSTELLDELRPSMTTSAVSLVLPNGCSAPGPAPKSARPLDVPAGPFVLLLGQLNERLDLSVLEALAVSGLPLVVVGPRTEREGATKEAFDRIFRSPTVHWLGARTPGDLPAYLDAAAVGITPYATTQFNRGSFPLKTLEYLAAGLPVVSTDLPSVRVVDSMHIRVADTPTDFVKETATCLELEKTTDLVQARRLATSGHTWESRARALHATLAT